MLIAFTTLPVKRRFGKIRRFSRIANYNKIPLKMPKAQAEGIPNRFLARIQKEPHPGSRVRFSLCRDQAVSSTLFLPASSFCLKRPLALKPGMEVDSSWLETLVLGLV